LSGRRRQENKQKTSVNTFLEERGRKEKKYHGLGSFEKSAEA